MALFERIQAAYTDLFRKPLLAIIMVICLLSIVAEYNQVTGPFELIRDILEEFNKNKDLNKFVKTITSLSLSIVKFLVENKNSTLYIMVIIIGLVVTTETLFVIIGLFLYIIFSKETILIKALVIQLTFLYYYFDSFIDRTVCICTILYFVFGFQHVIKMVGLEKELK